MPEVTISDDYAVLSTNRVRFYYGYEVIYCKDCETFQDNSYCDVDEDHEHEWAFSMKVLGMTFRIRIPERFEGDVGSGLLYGVGDHLEDRDSVEIL